MTLKRAIITEELIDLTQDTLTALILRQCIYWSTRVKDVEEYLDEIRQHRPYTSPEQQACEDEVFDSLYQNGWFFKKASEFREELMVKDSVETIRRRMRTLKDMGYLWERNNPYNPWDKVLQYRVNLAQIEWDLQKMGHTLATVMGKDYPIVKDAIAEALGENEQSSDQTRESSHNSGDAEEEKTVTENLQKQSPETSAQGSSETSSGTKDRETGTRKHRNSRFDFIPDDESSKETDPDSERNSRIIRDAEPTKAMVQKYDLDENEEQRFFELARNWKCDKDRKMDESRAGAIIQAMIDRFKAGKPKAQDRTLLMMFRHGELDKYKNPRQSDYERWQEVDRLIEEQERKEKSVACREHTGK
jgi:hypothetical protein